MGPRRQTWKSPMRRPRRARSRGGHLAPACGSLLLILLCLAGCRDDDLLARGVLVVGLESNPTNLDPRVATDAASSRIDDLIYSRLFRKDVNGEPVADLVESWEQEEEARTYRFRLRPGVLFHDGRPLEAADVRYTFESLLDSALGSPLRGSYQMISGIESPDPRTVVFHLREAFAPFLVSLDVGIVPRPRSGADQRPDQESFVGSGPFRFVSWDRGSQVCLQANEGYHEGAPRLREVRFKIVTDNTVRLLELRKGSIHLVQNEIEPGVLPALKEDPRLVVQERPGTTYSYLGFNLRDPVLRSLPVRQAIAHAIDRRAIVEHLLGGLAVPATGVLSPLNWAYVPDVKAFAYDPEEAKRLLDQAGFRDPDGQGPGVRFTLSYKTSHNELRRRIAEVIQSQLAAVGIGMEIRFYEWGTFYSDIMKGNFQIYTLSWVGVTDPDIYYYLFSSKSLPPAGANRGAYLNADLDRLLDEGRAARERGERQEIYGRVQRILAEGLPYVSLWYSSNVVAMDRRIQGFTLYPDGSLRSLKDVWASTP
jgi:peptide/nickel transport system substrate-binding protein